MDEEAVLDSTELKIDLSPLADAPGASLTATSTAGLLRAVKDNPAAWLSAIARAQRRLGDLKDKQKTHSQDLEEEALNQAELQEEINELAAQLDQVTKEKESWKECAAKRKAQLTELNVKCDARAVRHKEAISQLQQQLAGYESANKQKSREPPVARQQGHHKVLGGDYPSDDSDGPSGSDSDDPRPWRPVDRRGARIPRDSADTHVTDSSFARGLQGHRFKDPEKFDGESPSYYEWVSNMDTKLEADWSYATEEAKLAYLLSRTKGEAYDRIESRIPRGRRFQVRDPFQSIDECFQEMEVYFGEHDRANKAFDKFAVLQQKSNQSFTDFWAEFRKLRARMTMTPEQEMMHLRHKLNNRFKGKLAGSRFSPDAAGLSQFVRFLQDTQSDFQGMDVTREHDKPKDKTGNRKTTTTGSAKTGTGDAGAKPRNGKPKARLQPLSKDELQRRREQGLCFTPDCASKEHLTADCPLRAKKASNNALNVTEPPTDKAPTTKKSAVVESDSEND